MSKKAKSVTKAWALKYRGTDFFKGTMFGWTPPSLYGSRREARNHRGPDETPVCVRVTIEEVSA